MSSNKRRERADTDALRRMVRTDPVTGGAEPCCVCGDRDSEETHEIARGHARQHAVYRPRLQLPVCRECHELLGNYEQWPIERQLAIAVLLLIHEANHVRGRSPLAITWGDLKQWL